MPADARARLILATMAEEPVETSWEPDVSTVCEADVKVLRGFWSLARAPAPPARLGLTGGASRG